MLLIVYVDNEPTDAGLAVTLIPAAALTVIAYGAAVSASWSPSVATTKSLTVWAAGLVTPARSTVTASPALIVSPVIGDDEAVRSRSAAHGAMQDRPEAGLLPAASCVRDKNTGDIGEHRAIAGLAQADIRGRRRNRP